MFSRLIPDIARFRSNAGSGATGDRPETRRGPDIAGRARQAVGSASMVGRGHVPWPFRRTRSAPVQPSGAR